MLIYQATFYSSGSIKRGKSSNWKTKELKYFYLPHQKWLIIDHVDLQRKVEKWTKPSVKSIGVYMLKTVLFVVLSADAGNCSSY